MQIALPDPVKKVIGILEEHGYEAYAVGGCVRDSIMGVTPHDWDVTTSALPQEVKSCFDRTFDTGIEHGTVTVRMYGQSFEVTTYRVDGDYEDGRHPNDVTFTASLEEDLKRRDFTINAMAYSDRGGLVDLFGGADDIASRVIRCVGDPRERFSEDALRMLRALRFSAQLDFEIDPRTLDAIRELSPTLEKISAERITAEMVRLITSDHPERIETVYDTGLTAVFFPEWDEMMATPQHHHHHCYDVGHHTIEVMKHVSADRVMRLTAMLHDVAKPICRKTDPQGEDHFVGHPQLGADMARDILRRFKMDNATIDHVCTLVRHHDERPTPTRRNIRRLMSRVGAEHMPGLIELKIADVLGQSGYKREEKLAELSEIRRLYEEILAEGECVKISDLAVTGKDVIAAGVPRGPEIGRLLKRLLDMVIEDPTQNDREILLARIDEWK
ncbi:MAG: CCA tRNA nucleotidyltransferase [Lachnospiraceae bacterium]|nr:CCA tRNA nucleotidyltransferase [Lachnospiraceae bacterium]